jgi:OmpA-OmpF porin, OOP family
MKNFYVLCLIAFFAMMDGYAQSDNKWQMSLGVNVVDVRDPYSFTGMTKDYFNFTGNDLNYYGPPIRLAVARKFSESFMAQVSVSTNIVRKGIEWTDGDDLADDSFLYADAKLLYDLNKLVGETGWFDPYLGIGGGYSMMQINDFKVNGTWGINMWLNPHWAITLESSYNHNFKDTFKGDPYSGTGTDFFQHSLGITCRLGGAKPKDSDQDGIPDATDKCPKEKGVVSLQGCPETPKTDLPKPAETDMDGDGVTDAQDECPTVAGIATNKGCPIKDMDGDGVADADDFCPEVKGIAALYGCPETPDGDVEGEPVVEKPQGKVLNSAKDDLNKIVIYFDFDSDEIVESEMEKLRKASVLIKSLKQVHIQLKGHSDNFGSESYNQNLSERRVEKVMKYLKSLGVDTSYITAEGYGDKDPVSTNPDQNRRVEFKVR